jgi:multidrug efflux pump subunit AcrB
VTEWYGILLTHTLRHRKAALAAFVILLLGAVLLAPFLGSEFLPQIDDGRVVVKVKLPTGTAVGETNKLLSQVEAKLVGDPLIEGDYGRRQVWGPLLMKRRRGRS